MNITPDICFLVALEICNEALQQRHQIGGVFRQESVEPLCIGVDQGRASNPRGFAPLIGQMDHRCAPVGGRRRPHDQRHGFQLIK